MKRNTFLLMIAILLFLMIGTGSFSPGRTEPAPVQWTVSGEMVQAWPFERLPEQIFRCNDQLFTVSLNDGQLVIHQYIDAQWVEYQRFSAKSNRFTSVWVNLSDRNNRPEIIAGTDEPGFLYIYSLAQQQFQWTIRDNSKYLWSNITQIASGTFTGTGETEFIVQNSEGSLFYLKWVNDALNIVWKSPAPWRPIRSVQVVDLDRDFFDEILVTYQSGGLAVLKVEKNAVVTQWENYPWGKILNVHFGDWSQDGYPGFMVTTSQKMNYILTFADKNYRFAKAAWQSNYLIENLQYVPGETPEVIATDTSGNTHILGYHSARKQWNETRMIYTGRIARIIPGNGTHEFWLWGNNRQIGILAKTRADSSPNSGP